MMRKAASGLSVQHTQQQATAAATSTFMRFFKPCSHHKAGAGSDSPPDKQQGSRESFVHTPSLLKERKLKDMFNAAKPKGPAPKAAAPPAQEQAEEKDRDAGSAHGTAHK